MLVWVQVPNGEYEPSVPWVVVDSDSDMRAA